MSPNSRAPFKKNINPLDLVLMEVSDGPVPLRIDIVYAQAEHPENIFKEAIYRPDAGLWLHKDMAEIVLRAAELCYEMHGYVFVLRDGLRTVDAQAAMQETKLLRDNPQYSYGPDRMLAPPGVGGHPRGMAIDISLETDAGDVVPMGTQFDEFGKRADGMPLAHRENDEMPDDVRRNQKILEDLMCAAAKEQDLPMLPLPHEWWDFRFPAEYADEYAPLRESDLPANIKMMP